jgi:hypothetical protein
MFPKIESALKGQRFQDIDIQKNVMTSLWAVPEMFPTTNSGSVMGLNA